MQPASALGAAPDHRRTREVTPGLTLIRLRWDDGPVRAWVLRLDLGKGPRPSVALGARRLPSYRSTVREAAEREGALAAVNGDFGDYRPVHAFVRNGRVVQTGLDPREVVAFAGDSAFIARPRLRVIAVAADERLRLAAWTRRGRRDRRPPRPGPGPRGQRPRPDRRGPGVDRILGGRGDDACLSTFDPGAIPPEPPDTMRGGPGFDSYHADENDHVFGVEAVPAHPCDFGPS